MYNMFTPTAPLGGYKDSWYGRDLGKEALLGNTQEHQEYYRAIPSISMPSPPLNLRLAPEQFAYVINHAQDKVIIDSTPLPLLAQGGESFGFPPSGGGQHDCPFGGRARGSSKGMFTLEPRSVGGLIARVVVPIA